MARDNYRNVEGILQVVHDGLCHRCGACVGFCPAGTLAVSSDAWPTQVADCIHCNICVQVCSGLAVNYEGIGRHLFGDGYRFGPLMGTVRSAHIGHANDPEVRRHGASGGVITQVLVHLLESGRIKGAVVTVGNPDEPSQGKGIVARSREELLAAAQSRYATSPTLSVLTEIQKEEGPFALVGLPCQVHALRQRQMDDPRWKDRVPLAIGLLCHYNLPFTATKDAARLLAPPGTRLVRAQSRERDERGWPHNTVDLTFSDGSKWHSPLGPAQTFNILSRVGPLGRCLTCLDATAEFADFAIGDPWIRDERGNWKYEEPAGWSSIIVRTARGADVLEEAERAGALTLRPIPAEEIEQGQYTMMREKKHRVPIRMALRRLFGRAVPRYTVSLARPSVRDVWEEAVFLAGRLIPIFGPIRRLVLRFAFSSAGLRIVRRRMERRKRESKLETGN